MKEVIKYAIQEVSSGELLRVSNGKDESNNDVIKDGTNAVKRSMKN